MVDGEGRYGIEVPWIGSLIARGSTNRAVTGFDQIPEDQRPRDGLVTMVHWSFQAMVGLGLGLAGLGALYWTARRRGRDLLRSRRFLHAAVLAGPAAVAALELGWITTEVGRQPWVAFRVMRVEDAVTRGTGVWVSLAVLIVVYAAMTVGAVATLRSMARRWRDGEVIDLPTPYSPTGRRHRAHRGRT
jgi:cytochrome bd ubiquinol oxidase subunit I